MYVYIYIFFLFPFSWLSLLLRFSFPLAQSEEASALSENCVHLNSAFVFFMNRFAGIPCTLLSITVAHMYVEFALDGY